MGSGLELHVRLPGQQLRRKLHTRHGPMLVEHAAADVYDERHLGAAILVQLCLRGYRVRRVVHPRNDTVLVADASPHLRQQR